MHIVIASYTFLPSIGGVATTVSILADGFVEAGHQVTVVTTDEKPADYTDDFSYEVVRDFSRAELFELYKKADILIMSNLSMRLIYPLFFINRSFALSHHSERAWNLSGGLFSADTLRRHIIKRATHFMTSDYCGRQSGLPYKVTYPFANPRFIKPEIIKPATERKGILLVGRLEPEKGINWLLDRWEKTYEIVQEPLIIVGDGSLKEDVQNRAKSLPNVIYRGRLSLEDTAKEMGQAAYAIVPSLWAEPFGAVATEALAAGAVTIHTDRGGLPETTGKLGFHYDPDDDASFYSALKQAKEKREAIVENEAEALSYNQAVKERIDYFQPKNVVKTIVDTMG